MESEIIHVVQKSGMAGIPGHGKGGRPTPREKGELADGDENIGSGGGGGGERNGWKTDMGQKEGPYPAPTPMPMPMPKPDGGEGGRPAVGTAAEAPAHRAGNERVAFRSIGGAERIGA